MARILKCQSKSGRALGGKGPSKKDPDQDDDECQVGKEKRPPLDEGENRKKVRPVAAIHYRNHSSLDIKLGELTGGRQWRAADQSCASRCGHLSRRASGLGVAFVGVLCRRNDSQGVGRRSLKPSANIFRCGAWYDIKT
jgi:hypothetical protein